MAGFLSDTVQCNPPEATAVSEQCCKSITWVFAHLYTNGRMRGFMNLSSFCSMSGCMRSMGDLSSVSRQ